MSRYPIARIRDAARKLTANEEAVTLVGIVRLTGFDREKLRGRLRGITGLRAEIRCVRASVSTLATYSRADRLLVSRGIRVTARRIAAIVGVSPRAVTNKMHRFPEESAWRGVVGEVRHKELLRIRRMEWILRCHPEYPWSVTSMARALGVDKTVLHRLFRLQPEVRPACFARGGVSKKAAPS